VSGSCFLCGQRTWTLDRRSGEYLCPRHGYHWREVNVLSAPFVWQTHFRRLLWCYGEHVLAMAKWTGEEPETQADLAAWRGLGA
jgi:hypothetical protein